MGVRSTQAVTQTVANATDPNVAAYFTFNQRNAGPYNGLVVPFGCAAAGTIFKANGSIIYGQTGPNGMPAVYFNSTWDGTGGVGAGTDFLDGGNVSALNSGTSPMVIEGWFNQVLSTTRATIISKIVDGAPERTGWWITIGGGNQLQAIFADGTNACTITYPVPVVLGQWTYFRATWDGVNTGTLTVNGGVTVTVIQSLGSLSNSIKVTVASKSDQALKFKGYIANLRVTIGNSTNNLGYNTVANRNKSTQIQKSGQATGDPSVAAYLPLDQPVSANGVFATGASFIVTGTPTYGVPSLPGLGAGMTFNGSTDYLSTPTSPATLTITTGIPMVVEAWVKTTDTKAFMRVLGQRGGSAGYYMDFGPGGAGTPRFVVEDASTSIVATWGANVADGNWHFVRGTFDGNQTCTISVDGGTPVSGVQALALGAASTNPLRIAATGTETSAARLFDGSIADVRITIGNSVNNLGFVSSSARGSPGSSSLVSKQTPGNVTDPNVAAYFSMDQGSGNLTVPAGCAAAGTVFTAHGAPKYGQAAPAGLGTAITLNGTTDFFETAGDVPALNLGTSDAVWEFWLYLPSAPGSSSVILNKFDGPGNKGWNIDFNGVTGRPRIQVNDGAGHTSLLTHTTVLSLNTWHYIRCTWSFTNQVVTMAIDGGTPQSGTTAAGITSITNTVTSAIGARNVFDDRFLACSLADLRVTIGNSTNQSGYANPVLTPTVVQRPGNVTDPNVAAYFNMEQASGNLVVPAGCSLAGVLASKQGSPVYGITAGVPKGLGKAIQFAKATSDRFQNASASSFLAGPTGLGTQDMVVEFWAQTPVPSGSHEFVTQGGYFSGQFGSGGFYAIIINGVMTVSVSSTAVAPVASVSAPYPQDTNWHYWRVTWKNSTGTLTFYLDDVLQGTAQVAALAGVSCTSTRQFRIGLSLDQAIGLDGQIADIRITFGNTTNHSGYNSSGRAPTY